MDCNEFQNLLVPKLEPMDPDVAEVKEEEEYMFIVPGIVEPMIEVDQNCIKKESIQTKSSSESIRSLKVSFILIHSISFIKICNKQLFLDK